VTRQARVLRKRRRDQLRRARLWIVTVTVCAVIVVVGPSFLPGDREPEVGPAVQVEAVP